jgi:hypothetical protein
MALVDVDDLRTWPDPLRAFMDRFVAEVDVKRAGTGIEEEAPMVDALRGHELLAFHCTRLMANEVADIRRFGLRLLDEDLVRSRIAAADARGELSRAARAYAETRNVFATGNSAHRVGQVRCVLGRSVFDHDAGGVEPFLETWGGEAIRGGPADPPFELAGLGRPAIVVVKVSPASANGWHSFPSLPTTFAATMRDDWASADICWADPIPGKDVLDVWQPGHPDYDRHGLVRS